MADVIESFPVLTEKLVKLASNFWFRKANLRNANKNAIRNRHTQITINKEIARLGLERHQLSNCDCIGTAIGDEGGGKRVGIVANKHV